MSGERTQGLAHLNEEHNHSIQKIYPVGAGPVTLTAGGGAYTVGAIVQIVPAGTITDEFDIHWLSISSLSATAEYEFILYQGGAGSETEISRVAVTRGGVQLTSFQSACLTPLLDANTRISAALSSSSAGATGAIKIFYHTY